MYLCVFVRVCESACVGLCVRVLNSNEILRCSKDTFVINKKKHVDLNSSFLLTLIIIS